MGLDTIFQYLTTAFQYLTTVFQYLPSIIEKIFWIFLGYLITKFLRKNETKEEREFREKTTNTLELLKQNKTDLGNKEKRILFLEKILNKKITKDILLKAMKRYRLSIDVIVVDSSKKIRGFPKYLMDKLGFKRLKKSFAYGRYFAPPSKTEELLEDHDINYFIKKYIKTFVGRGEPKLSFVGVIDITRVSTYKCGEDEQAIFGQLGDDLDISVKSAIKLALKKGLTPKQIVEMAQKVASSNC